MKNLIKFTKMQGLGNDYIYIDCIHQNNVNKIISKVKQLSNRNFGIGSDGVILIFNSQIADFKMRIFNSDGSEAEMCGNGIRCVGKYVYEKELTTKAKLTIETLSGVKEVKLNIKEGRVETVTVNMGSPILDPKQIPVICDKEPVKDLKIEVKDAEFLFTCISMGNPHAITKIKDLDHFNVKKYGEIIEHYSLFPNRINVEFVEIINRKHIKMRVWERGAKETLACGTGACAAVVACSLNEYTDNEVDVSLLGGSLHIKWDRENETIYMTGDAKKVFEGEIRI